MFLLFAFQYMTAAAAAAPMQGTYIPQYTPVPPTAVPVEVRPPNTHTVHTTENLEDFIMSDCPLSYTHGLSLTSL